MTKLGRAIADPRVVFAGLALAGIIETVWTIPAFLSPSYPDWSTYAEAGQRLAKGLSPYASIANASFLSPPAMAVVWAGGMSASGWLLLKLCALAALVPVLGAKRGLPVLVLSVLQTPLQFDLLIGNVTELYIAAAVWFRRRKGWGGAAPLGLVLALAVKPAYLPLLIVTARLRPRDAMRVAAVAIATSAVTMAVTGAGAYLDYARSIAGWAGASAEWLGGNLGPGRYGLATPALVLGLAVLVLALRCRDDRRGTVLALGASLLIQPAYGFYYAALLIPAAVDLWEVDRRATFGAALLAVPLAYVSPALSGIAFIAAALPRTIRRAPEVPIGDPTGTR